MENITAEKTVTFIDYACKHNMHIRTSLWWAIRDRISDVYKATVADILQMDPFELSKCRQVGPLSLVNTAQVISEEYPLPELWHSFLEINTANIKSRIKGLTDNMRKGDNIFMAVNTGNGNVSLRKYKVKEVCNNFEEPKDRYILLETNIKLNGTETDRLTTDDLRKYSKEVDGIRIYRNMKDIRNSLTIWMKE